MTNQQRAQAIRSEIGANRTAFESWSIKDQDNMLNYIERLENNTQEKIKPIHVLLIILILAFAMLGESLFNNLIN